LAAAHRAKADKATAGLRAPAFVVYNKRVRVGGARKIPGSRGMSLLPDTGRILFGLGAIPTSPRVTIRGHAADRCQQTW
jgi:hypothetical protein